MQNLPAEILFNIVDSIGNPKDKFNFIIALGHWSRKEWLAAQVLQQNIQVSASCSPLGNVSFALLNPQFFQELEEMQTECKRLFSLIHEIEFDSFGSICHLPRVIDMFQGSLCCLKISLHPEQDHAVELFHSISRCIGLKTLVLFSVSNWSHLVPGMLLHLKSLSSLSLACCMKSKDEINQLLCAISQATGLKELKLHAHVDADFHPAIINVVRNLPHLEVLGLEDCYLDSLSNENLTELFISLSENTNLKDLRLGCLHGIGWILVKLQA